MTVEIDGICLRALERIAEERNKKTLEEWDNGNQFLRQKETAETVLNSVILGYLLSKYPNIFTEISNEVNEKTKEMVAKQSRSIEDIMEISCYLKEQGEMLASYWENK